MKHIPQEKRKAETKKKLVDSAMTLFSAKGYYQTNSKEIAENAGLAVGSFYRHFTDKRDILKFILSSYINDAFSDDESSEIKLNESNRKDVFKKLLRRGFELHRFTPGFYQQVTLVSMTDEEIGSVFQEYRNAMLARIKELIMASTPNLSQESCDITCTILYAAIEGTIHAVKFSPTSLDETLYIDQLSDLFDAYLTSVRDV